MLVSVCIKRVHTHKHTHKYAFAYMCIGISGRIHQELVTVVSSVEAKCIAREQRGKEFYFSLYSLFVPFEH